MGTHICARCPEQPEGATPLGSTSDNAEAQHLRFVQRELADLKSELTFIRQAAEGGQLALAAPSAGSAAGVAPQPPKPRAGLAPPPPPPPPPPSSAAKSAPAASAAAPQTAAVSADPDGVSDLMAAIRNAGGALKKPKQPDDADASVAYSPSIAAVATPTKNSDGRPNMAAIVPSTPPTLRKVDHSPGGTPHADPDRPNAANSSMSQIDQFLGSALKDKFKHMNGSPDDECGGLGRTDSDSR